MKKYETYKDSGLEWLGNVPEHWKVIRLKYCSNIVLGKMLMSAPPKGQEETYTLEKYLKSRNVGWLSLNLGKDDVEEMFFNKAEKKLYKLREGDIVMNEGGDIGKVALWHNVDYDCYIQNSINKITPSENLDSSFLSYWLYSVSMTGYFWSIVSQISIAHLTKEKLANTPILLPSLSEQRTIAAYLDHKVGQIDALISEKEKMVDDLKTYRYSVITEAVTKGLDKNVEMKESGLEWLGMVPGNWEVLPLKHLVSEPLQYGANESADDCIISDPRYIRITDITENGDLRDSTYKTLPRSKAIGYMLKKGDVLFARSGATVGKTYVFKEDYDACFAGYLIKASCNKKLIPMFLYYFTSSNSYENWKNSIFNQATIQNIGADKYSILPILLPSRSEQQKIVNYLNDKIDKIGNAISEQEHQLSDLKSYKASLITEAVTGKIDLRDWQTQKA
jgi:type I restriction enzyme, S subunit